MKSKISLFFLVLMYFQSGGVYSDAALNTCNSASGECKAALKSVYIQSGIAYIELENNLKPTSCVNAQWGTMWKVVLDGSQGAQEMYSLLLAAQLANQIVQLRTFDDSCNIAGAGLGM